MDRHAADVANIAFIVAAGVDRHDLALLPFLVGGRAVHAGAAGDQAIFKSKAAVGLLAAQSLDHLGLGDAGLARRNDGLHRLDHGLGCVFQRFQFFGGFLHALALEHVERIHPLGVRKCSAQHLRSIVRQEAEFGGDALWLEADLAQVIDRLLHGVDRAPGVGLGFRRPHRIELALEFLQAMADIGRLLGRASRIDQHRQIACDAGRIHVIEKISAVAAEQILHVVLGRRQHDVDPRLVHQTVEPMMIEGDRKSLGRLGIDVHGGPPWNPVSRES